MLCFLSVVFFALLFRENEAWHNCLFLLQCRMDKTMEILVKKHVTWGSINRGEVHLGVCLDEIIKSRF